MVVVQLIQEILNTQLGFNICPGPSGVGTWIESFLDLVNVDIIPGTGYSCPASTFNVIAAAFATQGYIQQSDMLDMLSWNGFTLFAPIAYAVAAIAGFISLAIGQPPRIWVWYFLGPALYSYLIYQRVDTTGVRWQIGHMPQNQNEVWKLVEVGMPPTRVINRPLENQVSRVFDLVTGSAPNVQVSDFFIWYDGFLSNVINDFVAFIGPYSLLNTINPLNTSNLPFAGWLGADGAAESALMGDRWFLLANLKWGILEDITSAKLTNPVARDAFATFIGGWCGERFVESINDVAFTLAANGDANNLPSSVFLASDQNVFEEHILNTDNNMELLATKLKTRKVDFASSPLPKLFTPDSPGSFRYSAFYDILGAQQPYAPDFQGPIPELRIPTEIGCHHYLEVLIDYFRWEAGRIFLGIVNSAPNTSYNIFDLNNSNADKAAKLIYNLFYGWDIKKIRNPLGGGTPLDRGEIRNFMIDMILVHLIRNEFAIVTQPVDVRFTGSRLAKNYAETSARTVGSKSKFGEIYVWATLMPYAQGILMYYLAMLYPFACIVMLVPGMHKSLLTWMAFWAWVKLWDVGFAIVTTIERTVWAMIGNSTKAASLHDQIVDMQSWGRVGFDPAVFDHMPAEPVAGVVPVVSTATCLLDGGSGGVCTPMGGGYAFGVAAGPMLNNFKILDRAMTIGPTLDLDLANSYYIYIMAALYLAVPAVTAQLVLGAKAGMASLATQALGQNASEAGRAAASGYSADLGQRAKANFASVGQAAEAASLQGRGLALQALGNINQALDQQVAGGHADQMGRIAGARGQGWGLYGQTYGANMGVNNASLGAQKTRAFGELALNDLGNNQWQQFLGGTTQQYRRLPKGTSGASPDATGASSSPDATGGGYKDLSINGGISLLNGAGSGYFQGQTINDRNVKTLAADIGQIGNAMASAANTFNVAGQQMATNVAGVGHGIDGYQASMTGAGLNRGANFKQAEAQFMANGDKWSAQNTMASQLSGSLAAQGAGGLDAGPKPSSFEGMAMSGMLGSEVQSAARYTENTPDRQGGFYGAVSSSAGGLRGQMSTISDMGLATHDQVQGDATAFTQKVPVNQDEAGRKALDLAVQWNRPGVSNAGLGGAPGGDSGRGSKLNWNTE